MAQHDPSSIIYRLWSGIQPPIDALRFLTILPIPGQASATDTQTARTIPWFPLAGLVIGLLLVLVGWATGMAWDASVQAVCIVVAWALITSGLHLDGLADTFDAVGSWRPRERKLEIMRDSRIGTMGVLAIGAVLLLKVTWLQAAGVNWWQAVLLAPVLGRWADLYAITWFPSARESGLGHAFQARFHQRAFWLPTIATIVLALGIGQIYGLVALGLVWLAIDQLARRWTHELGGLTGDTYGALCEIAEVITLAVLAF